MPKVNGHDNGPATSSAAPGSPPTPIVHTPPGTPFTTEAIKELIGHLEIPFHPSVIEWRVINTSKKDPHRGQVIPYADQRAYTDRLNELLTPAGWTRKYAVHTSANFQRSKDQKTVAKVFVTCELTILGLGSHSATGEEWADDDNAGTSAEAQAFKRACSCFGLGRYLYHFSGAWVDLDDHKRPKKAPQLAGWATADGWRQGLRPPQQLAQQSVQHEPPRPAAQGRSERKDSGDAATLIRQIEALQEPLGRGLYRGLLRTVARAWKPNQVQDVAVLQRVLAHMQAAQRGLLRLDAALNTRGRDALGPVLRALKLRSLANIDSLKTLEQVVLALEGAAGKAAC